MLETMLVVQRQFIRNVLFSVIVLLDSYLLIALGKPIRQLIF
jgi:hypothetical protein